jgi:hypothetical protein
MWHFLADVAVNAAEAGPDTDFEARLRTFFMWMALFALVCTWIWLYLRVRRRMTELPPGAEAPRDSDKTPD